MEANKQPAPTIIIEGKTVVGVRGGKSDIVRVTLPRWLDTIGTKAFYECAELTSLTLPVTLTCVDDCAFFSCRGLTSLKFPTEYFDKLSLWSFLWL